MPRERDALREQLLKAKRSLDRQLEVLQSPATPGGLGLRPPDNRAIIAELRSQLREIDEALADLESDES